MGGLVWFGCFGVFVFDLNVFGAFRCAVLGLCYVCCVIVCGVLLVGFCVSTMAGCGLHGVWVCLDLLLPDAVNSVVFILLLCGVVFVFGCLL